jgi:hypothetical protein
MTAQTTSSGQTVLRQPITGSRRFSNYWWAVVVTIGASGFFLAGISSYTKVNLLPFSDPGGGYNEFNQETGEVKIFRWGFPGKNRRIEVTCKTSDVQAVRVNLRDGLNPRRDLYLRVKGMRDIPLTRVGQPIALSELENQGAELARFLGVPLEGL